MKNNEVKGIYIHVPFCTHICAYCDFCKILYSKKFADDYIKTTVNELNKIDKKVNSIYIGGGSPSSLDEKQLEVLLQNAKRLLLDDGEFCVELNPEDLNDEKIKLLSKFGVNRVSFGVQTLNERLLKILNRHHNEEMVFEVINKLRKVGITNINLDLMYGLPTQTDEDLLYDINKFVEWKVNHISTYALLVEDNTYFSVKNIEALNDDLQANQFDLICKKLKDAGFIHYEISNFSKKGFESRQNLIYWHDERYIGVGPSASGYEDNVRYTNSKNISLYISNNINKKSEIVEGLEEEFEYIMLHLRLKEGINFNKYQDRFGFDFKERFSKQIAKLKDKNDIEVTNDSLSIKEEKMFISNLIISELLEDIEY